MYRILGRSYFITQRCHSINPGALFLLSISLQLYCAPFSVLSSFTWMDLCVVFTHRLSQIWGMMSFMVLEKFQPLFFQKFMLFLFSFLFLFFGSCYIYLQPFCGVFFVSYALFCILFSFFLTPGLQTEVSNWIILTYFMQLQIYSET